jgi:hypothetical protein
VFIVIVAVLCTPRSGSSMVAGILHHLNINMGDRLLPANRWCPLGFYEDERFLGLHRLLTFPHGDARRAALRLPAAQPARRPDLVGRYARAVAARKGAGGDWGLKDPRLVFAFDVLAAAAGAEDLRVVTVRRDPAESAASLRSLFGLSFSEATEVISTYARQRDAVVAAWAGPTLRIDYAGALADPVGTVLALAGFVDRTPTPAALAAIEPALRRHRDDDYSTGPSGGGGSTVGRDGARSRME